MMEEMEVHGKRPVRRPGTCRIATRRLNFGKRKN